MVVWSSFKNVRRWEKECAAARLYGHKYIWSTLTVSREVNQYGLAGERRVSVDFAGLVQEFRSEKVAEIERHCCRGKE